MSWYRSFKTILIVHMEVSRCESPLGISNHLEIAVFERKSECQRQEQNGRFVGHIGGEKLFKEEGILRF